MTTGIESVLCGGRLAGCRWFFPVGFFFSDLETLGGRFLFSFVFGLREALEAFPLLCFELINILCFYTSDKGAEVSIYNPDGRRSGNTVTVSVGPKLGKLCRRSTTSEQSEQ
jgi:hypothetical protein